MRSFMLAALCCAVIGCGSEAADPEPSPTDAASDSGSGGVDATTDETATDTGADAAEEVTTDAPLDSAADSTVDSASDAEPDTAVVETDSPGDVATDVAFDGPYSAVSVDDVSIAEGNSGTKSITFNLSLSAPSPVPVSVNWATADDSATAGSDYVAASGKVVFGPGIINVPVDLVINGDTTIELDESFFLDLSSPVNGTIARARGKATILDDDITGPTIAIGDVTVAEGNSGTVEAKFTVTLSEAATKTVTVSWATVDGTARAGGTLPGQTDYQPGSGTFSFAPGETSKVITVLVRGDVLDEPDETFEVELSSSVNATITDTRGTATITDDDPTPALSIADRADKEGNSGATKLFSFDVTLSAPSARTVSVNWATENGTAIAPSDYLFANGTVTFAPGETKKTVQVGVVGNNVVEPDETFKVKLSLPVNATVARAEAIGTIQNDD